MTDQQSAVEVMARAFVRAKGNDPDAELKLCGVGPCRPAWQHIEGPIHEALTALHFHLLASSWQIVPRAATMAMASACPRVVDYSSAVKAWTAMLAAAPQFLGSEG